MMPSISIIAPAYNESATIIESVNSLINLWYPRYELIVVNDGSSDGTLDKLINYFELVKVDILFREHIATQHILAIYRNPAFPKLTVINKLNGGKADSLNAGINIASGEYVCGIDADSLLEKDALMRIASTSLDIEVETVAVGGNIFPVNGCTISRGCIDKYALPSHPVALFQMIEYFRAFMAGRIGWASLNSLLIISGAFGLFSRKRMLEVGGYLTSSGQYHYDTVGEDMELVVRLSRYMRENKQPFKINYAYNANCWTEVPEDVHILLKQRDRWHRGLIEILSFHAKLFLNPSYGKLGMLSIPYFVLFEMIGPWIELQGYSMVILALSFGLLNIPVLILLFIATIMTGTFISTASLIIAGHEMRHFTFKEILKLIGYSILENFGIRQFVSLQRCLSYVNIIRSKSGWGKMTRKGFTNANQSQTITKP
jgi:cellulose synthase/poly-beta-1,6-N-acetylglucosamine synthase-like glycosyltransferase